MKQQKRWRRWFGTRERVEITHENSTRLLVKARTVFEVVRCPECGSEVTLVSRAARNSAGDSADGRLSLHTLHSPDEVEHKKAITTEARIDDV